MAGDGAAALGAPELAGTFVNPRGYAKQATVRVVGAELGGAIGATVAGLASGRQRVADLPEFGRVGYVAASATEVALIKAKTGLLRMSPTETVLARAPRTQLVSAELEEGRLISQLRLRFDDDQLWEFDVPAANRKTAQRLVHALNSTA